MSILNKVFATMKSVIGHSSIIGVQEQGTLVRFQGCNSKLKVEAMLREVWGPFCWLHLTKPSESPT